MGDEFKRNRPCRCPLPYRLSASSLSGGCATLKSHPHDGSGPAISNRFDFYRIPQRRQTRVSYAALLVGWVQQTTDMCFFGRMQKWRLACVPDAALPVGWGRRAHEPQRLQLHSSVLCRRHHHEFHAMLNIVMS